MTPEQRARLPRYAEEAISSLERDLREAQAVADGISATEAAVWRHPYDRNPIPVAPLGERVRFSLDGLDGYRWVDVSVKRDGDVEVMASSSLAVEPGASNVLVLRPIR